MPGTTPERRPPIPESALPETAPDALWPERIVELGRRLSASPECADERGQLWLLLGGALLRALRGAAWRQSGISEDDLRDLAAQKAFDLMRMFDRGEWNPGTSVPGQVVVFVNRVARNGLIDAGRRAGGRTQPLEEKHLARPAASDDADPGLGASRREFAEALVACAQALKPVHRLAWLFRVFYELPSRDIADHPEIRLNEANVNVILQRCRRQVGECMASKGFEPGDMPSGCFTALWSAFRASSLRSPEGVS